MQTPFAATFNAWQLWTFVYNGTQGLIYSNGVLAAGPTTLNSPTNLNTAINIGKGVLNLDGLMDDIKIYNKALTASQIKAIYNAKQ